VKYSRGLSPRTDPGARPEPNSRQPTGASRKPGLIPAALKPLVGTVAAGLSAFLVVQALVPSPTAKNVAATPPRRPNSEGSRPQGQTDHIRSYAFSLERLDGLSPHTRPGSAVELWVSRSGSRKTDGELLTSAAVVKRVLPPLTPLGPDTAILLVPDEVIPRLMRAELLGASITAVIVGKS
jgi:hypothetical protein